MRGHCNLCGKCCEAIRLRMSPEELQSETDHDGPSFPFVRKHWHNISENEAFQINPLLRLQKEAGIVDGDAWYYTCDMYDAKTHLCTAHDDRPDVCRLYPFYGSEYPSDYFTWYSATCGYITGDYPGERALMTELALEMSK